MIKSERTDSSATQIEKLGNGNVFVSDLCSGAMLPIGGSLFNRSQHSIFLRIDPENLERFLSRVDESVSQIPQPAIANWLGQINAQIDSAVYAPCDVFGKVFDSQYRNSSSHSFERSQLIGENGGQPALSQVLEAKLAECAEIAALAQIMLQRQGITSWYIGGAMLGSREHEYPEAHSYILIHHQGKYFVWDPANPVSTTIGNLPALYPVPESFLKGIRSGQETFLCELRPIIGEQSGIYGISDGSGIASEMILILSKQQKAAQTEIDRNGGTFESLGVNPPPIWAIEMLGPEHEALPSRMKSRRSENSEPLA